MRYQDKSKQGSFIRGEFANGQDYVYGTSYHNQVRGGWSRPDILRIQRDHDDWRNPSPYDSIDDTVRYTNGSIYVTTVDPNRNPPVPPYGSYLKGSCYWTPILGSGGHTGKMDEDAVIRRLGNKSLIKLRDQKVNIALTIGEGAKSLNTIASVALKLTSSIRSFRRGNFTAAFSALGLTTKGRGKSFSNAWLEMQYGIKPMMQDVSGIFDELTRETRKHGMRFVTRSSETFNDQYSAFDPNGAYAAAIDPSWMSHFGLRVTETVKQQAFMSCWWEVDNPALVLASSIGLTNPAEILWEVTPWSFVVDWFLPVGDYLGALTADHGFIFRGGTVTFNTLTEEEYQLVAKEPWFTGSYGNISNTPSCAGSAIHRVYRSNRRLMNAPSASLPTVKNPLSTGHVLNALALLRSTR